MGVAMNYRFRDLTISIPTDIATGDVCFQHTCFNLTNCGTPSLCDWRTIEPCRGFSLCGAVTRVGCPQFTLCAGYSLCDVTYACKATFCGGCSFLSPLVLEPGSELVFPEVLKSLKDELSQALREVEMHESALSEQQAVPETAEQIDALADRLRGALEELEARRRELG
jgi:hypothetical protein